jgi:sugar lactone lactonase YvrE
LRAEQETGPVAYHGEGSVWSERRGGLRWVDMLAGGAIDRRHVGSVVAALRPRHRGGAVIGVERGFALEDPDGTLTHLGELWSDNNVRMNEGGCDPDGRFYCGSMAYDQRPSAGALYRLDPDGSVHEALENVTISNGLEWSPDGSRAYYNDTPTHRIDVFD